MCGGFLSQLCASKHFALAQLRMPNGWVRGRSSVQGVRPTARQSHVRGASNWAAPTQHLSGTCGAIVQATRDTGAPALARSSGEPRAPTRKRRARGIRETKGLGRRGRGDEAMGTRDKEKQTRSIFRKWARASPEHWCNHVSPMLPVSLNFCSRVESFTSPCALMPRTAPKRSAGRAHVRTHGPRQPRAL